jgi:putative FmdB family regulatory protein
VPAYDYQCTECGRTVEVIHGVHAHGPKTCEVCGGTMRKLMSTPAIVFKGTGWAKKDARASGSSPGRSSSRPASKQGSVDGEGSDGAKAADGSSGSAGSTGSDGPSPAGPSSS